VRVTFLSHYYPPELGAAPSRISALAVGLAARGVEVTVHTGFPHYPGGTVASPYRNRPWAIEERDGVRVVRSAVYATPNRGTVRRLLDHAVLGATALATSPLSGPADVVVAESPPLFTAAAGVVYARLKGARLALNVSDLWPESAIELGALDDARAIALAEWLEALCYSRSAVVTAPTIGIVERLATHPTAAGRQVHVPPAVDVERFAGIAPRPPAGDGPLRLLYAGTLGMAQGMDSVLDAMALLDPGEAHLTIAGDGPDRAPLEHRARVEGLRNVELVGPVDPERVVGLHAETDVCVVPLRDLQLFRGALPTKLYEAMAAGRAVVIAARGESADLVTSTGSGVAVTPEDPSALASAIRLHRDDAAATVRYGAAARAVAARHSREAAVGRWAEILSALAPAADRRSARAAGGRRRPG
jgi:glycosyltransferase involved in cell wall biosynthesis